MWAELDHCDWQRVLVNQAEGNCLGKEHTKIKVPGPPFWKLVVRLGALQKKNFTAMNTDTEQSSPVSDKRI